MINKIDVIVREHKDIAYGYMVLCPPLENDYLEVLMNTLNNIPGAKYIKYCTYQDFKSSGEKVKVPYNSSSKHEVDRGTLQFRMIIYYEISEKPSRVKKAIKCSQKKI